MLYIAWILRDDRFGQKVSRYNHNTTKLLVRVRVRERVKKNHKDQHTGYFKLNVETSHRAILICGYFSSSFSRVL